MPINQPNPERGTGVRKPGTGVRPNPAAGAAPAPSAGANRPTGRRPGAPLGAGARPPLRSASAAAAAGGGSKTNKYLMIGILVALVGMVAYGFIPRKDVNGNPKPGLFITLANKYLKLKIDSKSDGSDPALPDLDRRYANALECRSRAEAYLEDQQKYADSPDKLTEVVRKQVCDQLEKYRGEVESGTDDLARVAAAAGKNTAVSPDKAKEEQKIQKTTAMKLGKALVQWRGPKDQIFAKAGAPEFVANKFNPPAPEEKKPEEKKNPRRGETMVAPLKPSDIPKPPGEPEKPKEPVKPEPEKPKEEAKQEPKPEPEKPKPAEPKTEPEKPKEVAKADPKPESEKPKTEPEKPKEEPKAEPKPDPKPEAKPEPKTVPEKPKEEAKPEPKPERKLETVLAEAEKLTQDGAPKAKEVLAASRNLPDDPEQLKTLAMKLETAQAFFVKAKETYAGVKDEAPASAEVATRMAKIDKILSLLQNAADGIKSKMK